MQLPVVYSRTNAIKNQISHSVQQACMRSGKTKVVCSAAAIAAGTVGLARVFDKSWSDIARDGAIGGATGAVAGAITGCVGGAAIGVWAAGAGAIPGCLAGIIPGALGGGFFGLVGGVVSVTEDGSIQVDANGNVVGTGVNTSTTTPMPAETENILTVNEVYYGAGQYNAHLARYGVLREFVVRDSQNRYRKAIFIPYTQVPSTSLFESAFGDRVAGQQSGSTKGRNSQRDERFVVCGTTGSLSCGAGATVWTNNGTATQGCSYAGGCYVFSSSTTFTAPNQAITYTHQPIKSEPFFASGFNGQVPPAALNKPLSPDFVAGLANAAWANAGAATGPEGVYDPNNRVTGDDVRAVQALNPQDRALLQHLYQGVADLNRGSTQDNPLPEPTPVNIVNNPPATGTQTPTDPADEDLELNVGIPIGNPIQPVIDFLSGPLAPFISPTFQSVQGQCPIWEVDMREWFGSFLDKDWRGNAVAQTSTQASARTFLQWNSKPVCDFLNDHYQIIQLFCSILIVVAGFMRFFDNS